MTTVLIILSILIALLGISVSIWSLIDTRKKYYDEFIQDREDRAND